MHLRSNIPMNIDDAGISSDDGLLVLQVVAEALFELDRRNEALSRLVCKALCDTIGDMLTVLAIESGIRPFLPLPAAFLRITEIEFISSLNLPVPDSWQFLESLISAAKGWKDIKKIKLVIDMDEDGMGHAIPLALRRTPSSSGARYLWI
jgi:hypothetical protein